MPNDNHKDAHRSYNLTVVFLFECIFDLGPRAPYMLLTPRYLNPALSIVHTYRHCDFVYGHLISEVFILSTKWLKNLCVQ